MSGFFSSGRNYGAKPSPVKSYSSYNVTSAPCANVGAYPPVEANHQKVYTHQQNTYEVSTVTAPVVKPHHEYSHQNSYEHSHSATNGHGHGMEHGHGHGHGQEHGHGHGQEHGHGHGQMVEHNPQHAVSHHQSSYGYSENKPAHNVVSHQSSYGYSSSTNGRVPPKGHGSPYPPKGMGGGSSPFSSLLPSTFPKGTDPQVMNSFQMADGDRSGFIDDKELQRALSSCNKNFSLRTVHLLIFLFTNNTSKKIGPKEFAELFYELKNWREMFEKFDHDRSGKMDGRELQHALATLNFSVSPMVLDLLLSKYDKSGRQKGLDYDNFIECCLVVKGLTEKFKDKDKLCTGIATFSYEAFMLTVLPFVIA